jgi:transposase-like protein
VARYGQAFRERIVARLLPPESAAIDVVAREVGVSTATLERWRAQALAAPGELANSQRWTPTARLEAVITTAAMDEAARSAWCREQGLILSTKSGRVRQCRKAGDPCLGVRHACQPLYRAQGIHRGSYTDLL